MGVGGTPQGIVAVCAVKTLGGVIQGQLAPTNEEEHAKAVDAGRSGACAGLAWSSTWVSDQPRGQFPYARKKL